MSWPQPTAQYGQTLSVTVAPRSRDVFATVCRLNGWGLESTGRSYIGVSFEVEGHTTVREASYSLYSPTVPESRPKMEFSDGPSGTVYRPPR